MQNHPIVAIVQARMGATRLAGKPLKKVLGRPLLSYQLERLRRSSTLDKIVIATTTAPQDQAIIDLCQAESVEVYQGSEQDVLDRYYCAAKHYKAKVVVRVTGDCPLIDPSVLDLVVNYYLHHEKCDYVSNTLQLTYPRGLDVEVFSFELLQRAAMEAQQPEEREHVTPYFYRHPELFHLSNVACAANLSKHRWTVDTPEDFQLIEHIISALYPIKPAFDMQDVLNLLRDNPGWSQINAHIKQKTL